jgi:hypothetical protein
LIQGQNYLYRLAVPAVLLGYPSYIVFVAV